MKTDEAIRQLESLIADEDGYPFASSNVAVDGDDLLRTAHRGLVELRRLRVLPRLVGTVTMLLAHCGGNSEAYGLARKATETVLEDWRAACEGVPETEPDLVGRQQEVVRVFKARRFDAFFDDEVLNDLAEEVVEALERFDG